MRLHSDTLTEGQILQVLREEQKAGRIASGVYFAALERKGSQSHANAFEVKLGTSYKVAGDGRRWGNSGGYGATSQTTGEYAATYDEWGWLFAALYKLDPAMLAGSKSYPIYQDGEHFDDCTGWSYNPARLLPILEHDELSPFHGHADFATNDPFPYVRRKPQAGRIGYGRIHADAPRYVISGALHMPRTVAGVRAFAHLGT